MTKREIHTDPLTAQKIFDDLSPIIEKYFNNPLEMVDVFAKYLGGFGAEAMKKHDITFAAMISGILERVAQGLSVRGHDIRFEGAYEIPDPENGATH